MAVVFNFTTRWMLKAGAGSRRHNCACVLPFIMIRIVSEPHHHSLATGR
jgi:hypothetical protein